MSCDPIIDEAHHATAGSDDGLLGHFNPALILGLTATPERPDGKPVLELFRNALIVETYLDRMRGRKGLTFCVNVRHSESLAELYRQHGVPARSVSASMPAHERDKALAAFARGELLMLCARDLRNEGWDVRTSRSCCWPARHSWCGSSTNGHGRGPRPCRRTGFNSM